jgi:hypothetical protein
MERGEVFPPQEVPAQQKFAIGKKNQQWHERPPCN